MTRALFLAACFASTLISLVSSEMMGQSQQYQPGQQGQRMNGQETGSTQMIEPKGKTGDMQGDKAGDGGGNTMMNAANPVIIIATNAGGSSQMQQMNTAVQPPQATHTVTVGGPSGLIYSPESVQAAQYDMIQFNFMSKNHTVTQSTFQDPCKKMQPMPMPAAGMPVAAGMPSAGTPPTASPPPTMMQPIDSGFMPTTDTGPLPMMLLQVTTPPTTPLWFYCRQKTPKPHCGAGSGMTFSINPHLPGAGDKTQAAFKAKAMMSMANSTVAGSAVASGAPMMPAAAPAPVAAGSSGSQAMGQQSQPQAPPPAASPPPPAPMAQAPSAAPMAQAPPPAAPMAPPPPPGPAPMAMAQGTGQTQNGVCECSCLCGAAAFPNAMQGVGMMGGMPGAVPAAAGGGMKRRV